MLIMKGELKKIRTYIIQNRINKIYTTTPYVRLPQLLDGFII